jgi:HTH-type transcriptional regulator/antitoxin HigA
MNIRPIKSEADYNAALAEIDRLWGAEPNTDEGDKLDVLLTLVDAYEQEHYRMALTFHITRCALRC